MWWGSGIWGFWELAVLGCCNTVLGFGFVLVGGGYCVLVTYDFGVSGICEFGWILVLVWFGVMQFCILNLCFVMLWGCV